MASKEHAFYWSELLPELLGLVLLRLHSFTDRARFSAVCRPWHSAARQKQLPPPMPWLLLSQGSYLDLAGNSFNDLNVPGDACCRGSVDDRLLLGCNCGRHNCVRHFLASPSSMTVLPVPKSIEVILKVVALPTAGSSSDPLVAVLGSYLESPFMSCRIIYVCRAGVDRAIDTEGNAMWTQHDHVYDMAFFRGKLYALGFYMTLHEIELGEDSSGSPTITNVNSMTNSDDSEEKRDLFRFHDRYLIQSGDRLLMVKQWIDRVSAHKTLFSTRRFAVFEADFGGTQTRYRWREVRSLHGHALFVGRHGSKSLPAGDGQCGAQEDCIYFVNEIAEHDVLRFRSLVDPRDRDGWSVTHRPGVFNVRDGTLTDPLPPSASAPQERKPQWFPTWLFPQ